MLCVTIFLNQNSDDKPLHFGAIVCLLGARYKSYCSNIGRTLLVNPTEKMQVSEAFELNFRIFSH